LCTGGGSGIGAAVAARYTADGGRVAVVDVNTDAAESTAAALEGAISVPTDITDEQAVETLVARMVRHYGRLDAVYNGAAILLPEDVLTAPLASFQRQLAVNTVGTLAVTKAAAPLLAAARGAVVNTSSVVVDIARPQRGLYAASKGAVVPLTRHLALEMAPEVRVNAVSPGPTLTGMVRDYYRSLGNTMQEGLAVVGSQVMLNRVADPSELAAAVCFLLSDDASYVTGTVLTVDGGMTAK
jgi:NAD(P)-dependent dehydrogenase (short-subunit alcohol dehydrogenase family)